MYVNEIYHTRVDQAHPPSGVCSRYLTKACFSTRR